MFRQKQYEQMMASTTSLALTFETEESSTTEEEERSREFERKSLLDAKIEKNMKAIEQTKERRRSSIEERSTGLPADSNHSNVDDKIRMTVSERGKRNSELSVSEHCPALNTQKEKASDLTISEHGSTCPAHINHKSNLDLDTHQGNPLKAADVRRRRKSTNDELLSPGEKRHARLLIARNRRQRASSIASPEGEGQKEGNCRELIEERFETRPRLRKSGYTRTHSLDDDLLGLQNKTNEPENLIRRSSSNKRLSGGNDSRRISGGSNRPRERLHRSNLRRALSINSSNSPGLSNEPTRRSSSRRKLSVESESIPVGSFRRRKAASAIALSELGNAPRESGSKSHGDASSRRMECGSSQNFHSLGTKSKTFEQSPSDKQNFTWTWKNVKMEPTTLRGSIEGNDALKTSPSQTKDAARSLFGQDSFSSPPSHGNHTRSLSMQTGSDYTQMDCPTPNHNTSKPQRAQTKISPKRTSKRADSLLSPGARRTSRFKESVVSPVERTASYPNLPLSSPVARNISSNWKKTRASNHRWQVSTSKDMVAETSALDAFKFENAVNKKDIGAIAKFLKLSNEAEEELERQKEEERQARRAHVRARRRQTSIEWAT